MDKISGDLIARCGSAACCANEFVILPDNGDAGFEEYFNRKADGVYEIRHLFTRKKEQTRLILKYPSPLSEKYEHDEQMLRRFFSSTEVVSCNQPFEGCFGIDVTAYLRNTSDPRLDQLISFIRLHPEITFVLFAYTGDPRQALPLLETFDQYFPLQSFQLTLPDADRLTEYLCSLVSAFCPECDDTIMKDMKAFFAEDSAGYDTAEFFARELQERNFLGERQILLDTIKYMKDCTGRGGSANSFGY